MTIDLTALKAGRADARAAGREPGMSAATGDALIAVAEAALGLSEHFDFAPSVRKFHEPSMQRLIAVIETVIPPPVPSWTIESHQKHANGHHLVLAHSATGVHADVTLLPNRATVIFDGPGRRPHIALLHAHAAILERVDEMAAVGPPHVEASTYVLQVVGARAWEVLRPVFGDAYAGAVL